MNPCYLGLGSNQKHPQRQLRLAIKAIKKIPCTAVLKVSKLHTTKAWGRQVQPDFCNAVVELSTTLSPFMLLTYCQNIEKQQGRTRKIPWGPRTLDIDILLFGPRRIRSKKLKIPHPYLSVRDFVLTPLLEINPKIQLPVVDELRSLV